MGTRGSVKVCRDLKTWHPNDLMDMSSKLFSREERVNFQREKLNIAPWRRNIVVTEHPSFKNDIASSSPATMSSDTLLPEARPSEEVSTSFPDEKPNCQRSSVSNATNRGKKAGKRASKKSRNVGPTRPGPTAPKPGPTYPQDVLARKSKKKKNKKKKNELVGPTKPEEIDIISNDDEASGSSSGTDSFSSSEKKKKKNSMSGWKQEWNSEEEIEGLDVDEKSESETPAEEYRFYNENGVEVGSHRFYKYPRSSMILSNSRRHKYLEDGEDDDREHGDISPRTSQRLSLRSALSSKSGISDLSAAPTVMSKSARSTVSDLSYRSDAHLRPGLGETQRKALHTPYISDYMPNASWHSPHYKDYEEEPYDMHTGQRQRKGSRNNEIRFFK